MAISNTEVLKETCTNLIFYEEEEGEEGEKDTITIEKYADTGVYEDSVLIDETDTIFSFVKDNLLNYKALIESYSIKCYPLDVPTDEQILEIVMNTIIMNHRYSVTSEVINLAKILNNSTIYYSYSDTESMTESGEEEEDEEEEEEEDQKYEITIKKEALRDFKRQVIEHNVKMIEKQLDILALVTENLSEEMIQSRLKREIFVNYIACIRDRNSYVMENTPRGIVIMNIKGDYYADKSVPFEYLEVVYRKFCCMFKCKDVYVVMDNELKEIDLVPKAKTKDTKVFASFKKYNTASNKSVASIPMKKNTLSINKTSLEEKNKIVLKQRINNYKYLGRISNFSLIQKIDRKKVDKKANLSFSDYKKNIKIKK